MAPSNGTLLWHPSAKVGAHPPHGAVQHKPGTQQWHPRQTRLNPHLAPSNGTLRQVRQCWCPPATKQSPSPSKLVPHLQCHPAMAPSNAPYVKSAKVGAHPPGIEQWDSAMAAYVKSAKVGAHRSKNPYRQTYLGKTE